MDRNKAFELIRDTFNLIMGSNYSFSIVKSTICGGLKEDCSNLPDVMTAISQWHDRNPYDNNIDHFMNWYTLLRPGEIKEEKKGKNSKVSEENKELRRELVKTQQELRTEKERSKQKEQKYEEENRNLASSMTILSDAITKTIAETKLNDIEKTVVAGLKERIDRYIFEQYGKIDKKVNVVTEYTQNEVTGILHKKFDTVLKFVSNNEPVYLVGPAGSGKNVLCKQVAEAMGLEFYFSNAVTQEYKITGFTDANGHFHESQFYKAFTKGGLFMLDEMDASIPEVLIILNAAIANRYFDFPAPIGKVEANVNFRVVAAGNTFGYGADASYVGRNVLDAASLDRFAMVEVDYDDGIAMSVTNQNRDLVSFCTAFRREAHKAGIDIVVSYRAMERMAKMDGLISLPELISTCLVKGLEKDDIHIIVDKMRGCRGKYMDALVELEAMCA